MLLSNICRGVAVAKETKKAGRRSGFALLAEDDDQQIASQYDFIDGVLSPRALPSITVASTAITSRRIANSSIAAPAKIEMPRTLFTRRGLCMLYTASSTIGIDDGSYRGDFSSGAGSSLSGLTQALRRHRGFSTSSRTIPLLLDNSEAVSRAGYEPSEIMDKDSYFQSSNEEDGAEDESIAVMSLLLHLSRFNDRQRKNRRKIRPGLSAHKYLAAMRSKKMQQPQQEPSAGAQDNQAAKDETAMELLAKTPEPYNVDDLVALWAPLLSIFDGAEALAAGSLKTEGDQPATSDPEQQGLELQPLTVEPKEPSAADIIANYYLLYATSDRSTKQKMLTEAFVDAMQASALEEHRRLFSTIAKASGLLKLDVGKQFPHQQESVNTIDLSGAVLLPPAAEATRRSMKKLPVHRAYAAPEKPKNTPFGTWMKPKTLGGGTPKVISAMQPQEQEQADSSFNVKGNSKSNNSQGQQQQQQQQQQTSSMNRLPKIIEKGANNNNNNDDDKNQTNEAWSLVPQEVVTAVENDLLKRIEQRAASIAKTVLSLPGSGRSLRSDLKQALRLWSKKALRAPNNQHEKLSDDADADGEANDIEAKRKAARRLDPLYALSGPPPSPSPTNNNVNNQIEDHRKQMIRHGRPNDDQKSPNDDSIEDEDEDEDEDEEQPRQKRKVVIAINRRQPRQQLLPTIQRRGGGILRREPNQRSQLLLEGVVEVNQADEYAESYEEAAEEEEEEEEEDGGAGELVEERSFEDQKQQLDTTTMSASASVEASDSTATTQVKPPSSRTKPVAGAKSTRSTNNLSPRQKEDIQITITTTKKRFRPEPVKIGDSISVGNSSSSLPSTMEEVVSPISVARQQRIVGIQRRPSQAWIADPNAMLADVAEEVSIGTVAAAPVAVVEAAAVEKKRLPPPPSENEQEESEEEGDDENEDNAQAAISGGGDGNISVSGVDDRRLQQRQQRRQQKIVARSKREAEFKEAQPVSPPRPPPVKSKAAVAAATILLLQNPQPNRPKLARRMSDTFAAFPQQQLDLFNKLLLTEDNNGETAAGSTKMKVMRKKSNVISTKSNKDQKGTFDSFAGDGAGEDEAAEVDNDATVAAEGGGKKAKGKKGGNRQRRKKVTRRFSDGGGNDDNDGGGLGGQIAEFLNNNRGRESGSPSRRSSKLSTGNKSHRESLSDASAAASLAAQKSALPPKKPQPFVAGVPEDPDIFKRLKQRAIDEEAKAAKAAAAAEKKRKEKLKRIDSLLAEEAGLVDEDGNPVEKERSKLDGGGDDDDDADVEPAGLQSLEGAVEVKANFQRGRKGPVDSTTRTRPTRPVRSSKEVAAADATPPVTAATLTPASTSISIELLKDPSLTMVPPAEESTPLPTMILSRSPSKAPSVEESMSQTMTALSKSPTTTKSPTTKSPTTKSPTKAGSVTPKKTKSSASIRPKIARTPSTPMVVEELPKLDKEHSKDGTLATPGFDLGLKSSSVVELLEQLEKKTSSVTPAAMSRQSTKAVAIRVSVTPVFVSSSSSASSTPEPRPPVKAQPQPAAAAEEVPVEIIEEIPIAEVTKEQQIRRRQEALEKRKRELEAARTAELEAQEAEGDRREQVARAVEDEARRINEEATKAFERLLQERKLQALELERQEADIVRQSGYASQLKDLEQKKKEAFKAKFLEEERRRRASMALRRVEEKLQRALTGELDDDSDDDDLLDEVDEHLPGIEEGGQGATPKPARMGMKAAAALRAERRAKYGKRVRAAMQAQRIPSPVARLMQLRVQHWGLDNHAMRLTRCFVWSYFQALRKVINGHSTDGGGSSSRDYAMVLI